MNPVNVVCMRCGFTGAVNKVTATLRCSCGSSDLDLYTGSPEQNAHIASLRQPKQAAQAPSFKEFMLGKTAKPQPVEQGWSEYEGPMPGPNPMSNNVTEPVRCPSCHGTKYDIQDGGPCRACSGKGVIQPTTADMQEPQVARHQYPSTQTKVPFMGRKVNTAKTRRPKGTEQNRRAAGRRSQDPLGSPEEHIRATTPGYTNQGPRGPRNSGDFAWGNTDTHYPSADSRSPAMAYWEPRNYAASGDPLQMHGTSCPTCGQGPLSLQKDHAEDAWMTCPKCGALANIDGNPEIDPYNLPQGFAPHRGFKAARKKLFGSSRKTGRLIAAVTTIARTNPGLTHREVLELARTSLRKFPEPR